MIGKKEDFNFRELHHKILLLTDDPENVDVMSTVFPSEIGDNGLLLYGYIDHVISSVNESESDRRLKQNINPLSEKYLKLFDDIEVRSYEFIRENSKRTHIGVIAQEVESAALKNGTLRFAGVTHDEDVDRYYVSYNDISMLHMAHYKNFLKSYEEKIQSLENEISALRDEIQNLKKF